MTSTSNSITALGYTFTTAPAPELEALFQNTDGWIGADGIYTTPLDNGKVLWLFSDTFVGKVRDGKRLDWTMINNSIAVTKIGSMDKPEFYYKSGENGEPASVITPDFGEGYYWLFAGTVTSKGLFIFMPRIINEDNGTGFSFRGIGTTLGHISNPDDSPIEWKITQRPVPFNTFGSDESTSFGSAILREGTEAYIYGLQSTRTKDGKRASSMILAKVAEDKLGEFDSWKFYSNGEWTDDCTKCEPICPDPPTEFSISYLPGLKKYAFVYTEGGIFGRIMVRLAPRPEGPWGEQVMVYDCPDKDWHEKAFSYAAKAHPELAASPNELIITYATNSTHYDDLFDDARLYWPRFIRVTIKPAP